MIIEKLVSVLKNTLQKTSLKGDEKSIKVGWAISLPINHSKPYTYYINGSLTNIYQPIPKNLYPAAGTYSTAIEMAQGNCFANESLINKESLKSY
jgi:hypothetical protein